MRSRTERALPDTPSDPQTGEAIRTAPQRIRVLALAVLVFRDHVLLAEGYDVVKQQRFYRPLGGEVEFGEATAEAVVRELLEETGRTIEVRAPLGVVENRFTFNGHSGHEVCFEFVAEFASGSAPANLDPVVCDEGGRPFTAAWLPLAEVLGGMHIVYPDGLPSRLAEWVNSL